MAVKTLCKMKDTPLPIAVDIYKMMCESMIPKSQEAYEKMLENLAYDYLNELKKRHERKSQLTTCNWNDFLNDLSFTEGYISLFDGTIYGIWIAYECLSLILLTSDNGMSDRLQVFKFENNEFWVIYEDGKIIFLRPDEY